MKLLQRILTNVPDQVLSTAIIIGIGYIFVRGCMAVWAEPPGATFYGIVLAIGAFCGVFVSLVPLQPPDKNKDTND